MNVAFETPDQPEVLNLIAELDAFHLSLYPPESVYALDLASLKQSNVLFAVARGTSQAAIGCGAIVVTPEYGELKRMYVQPDARGQGVAKKLLGTLESAAKAQGCTLLTLETGPYQHQAIALYERNGYQRRGPFGNYPDDPFSI